MNFEYIDGESDSQSYNNVFGDTFVLIGRNPHCGCPLAIDMNPDQASQKEFLDRGLLLEFLSEGAAKEAWDSASWPCSHSKP
jgi:hypothetical protein